MSEVVLRVSGATRRFGAVTAVDAVDLEVVRGRTLALLGPSGCGKTTMLRLLAGFERPDEGSVEIDGRVVAGRGAWVPPERRRVGMVFQDYALFPHLDVRRNVGFGLGRRAGAAGAARVREVLELVGLAGFEHRYPHELSGGQQQRVALARALTPNPALILLDEPFSNLDAALRVQVRTDVHRILQAAGATAVFVTHDQEEALSLADEVAVMHDGRLVQQATPEALYRAPADRRVAAFVGDADFVPGESDGDKVTTDLGVLVLAAPTTGAVEVLLRPEDVRLTPDAEGEAVVLERTFFGHDQVLTLRLPSGRVIRSRYGPVSPVAPGERCRVAVDGPVQAYPVG